MSLHRWIRSFFDCKSVRARTKSSPLRRVLEELENRLAPAVYVWDNGAGNLDWSNPVNWDVGGMNPAAAPGATDDVNFNGAGTGTIINVGGTIQSLTLSAGGYTLTSPMVGQTLQVSVSIGHSTGTNTITVGLTGTATLDVTGGTLNLNGSAPNTFSGTASVSVGTLHLAKAANTNAIGGDLNISGAGKVTMVSSGSSNQIPNASAVTMSGAGSVFNGTGVNAGQANVTETIGSLTMTGGSFSPGSDSNWTITGTMSVTGGGNTIFVGNSGTTMSVGGLNLTNMTATAGGNVATNNSFTIYGNSGTRVTQVTVGASGVTLDNSRLNMRKGNLGSRLILNGDVTTAGVSTSFISEDTAGGTTFTAFEMQLGGSAGAVTRTFTAGTANLSITVPLSNGLATPASIAKAGAGVMTLGAANTYTGTTFVNAGTLSISSDLNLGPVPGSPTPATVIVDDGATLRGNSTVTLHENRGIAIGPSAGVGGVSFEAFSGTMTINGAITDNGAGQGSLTKIGVGTLTLAGPSANTYSGLTTVTAGELILNKTPGVNAVPGNLLVSTGVASLAASNQISDSADVSTTGTGRMNFGNLNETIANFSVSGTGGTGTTGGVGQGNGGTVVVTGTTTTANTATFTVNSNGHWTTNVLVHDSATPSIVGGNSTTVVGQLVIGPGGLIFGAGATISLAAGDAGALGSRVTLGGDVAMTGSSGTAGFTVGSGTDGERTIDLGGAVRTFTVNNGSAGTDGTINVTVQNGSLTKEGAGFLALAGTTANTYTGLTTVNAGLLALNKNANTNAIGGDLLIQSGALVTMATSATSDQIPDTATVTMSGSGSVFNGTGVNAGVAAVTETIGNLIVTGGTVNMGTGSNWTVTGDVSFTGGAGDTRMVGNSGFLASFGSLALINMTGSDNGNINNPNHFTIFGNSTSVQSTIRVGAGGVSLDGSVINLRQGGGGALGSRLIVDGDLATTGTTASTIRLDTAGGTTGSFGVQLSSLAGPVNRTFDIAGGGADLSIGVPIQNGAATPGSITKTGPGMLTLTGTGTFTGTTTVNEGTLGLSADNNLGPAPGSPTPGHLVLTDGATLRANASFALNANRGVAVGPTAGSGSANIIVPTSGQTLTINGIIANNGAGVGGINVLAGAGTVTLAGSAANTFTGLTTVDGGQLRLGKAANTNAIGGDLLIQSAGKLLFVASGSSDQIPDTATVSMTDVGSVFNGTGNNVGHANVTETIGNLHVSGGQMNAATSLWTIVGDGSFTGGAGNTVYLGNSGSQIYFGSLTLIDMTAIPGGTVGLPNSFAVYGASASIVGTVGVGAGGLTLDNSRFNLRRGGGGQLGSRLLLEGSVTTIGPFQSFISEDAGGGTNGSREIQLSGSAGAFDRTFNVGSGADLTVSVPIVNGAATSGAITKTGPGTMFPTFANTYTGSTSILDGVLEIAADSRLGTAPGSPAPDHLVIDGGTLRTTAAFTLNANRGIGLGPTVGVGQGTIDVVTGTVVYDGIMADRGAGVGGLVKLGAGTLSLGGVSTFTGLLAVEQGAIAIGAAAGIGPTSDITIGSIGNTATLTLNNTNTYVLTTGDVSIGNGGTGTLQKNSGNATIGGGVLDTGVSTLNNDVGDLLVGNGLAIDSLRVGFRSTAGNSTANLTVQAGAVTIGSGSQDLVIGRHTTPTNTTTIEGMLDLTGASSVVILVNELAMGTIVAGSSTGANNFAIGNLLLSAAGTNDITANLVNVSDSATFSGNNNGLGSTIVFGAGDNTLFADNIHISRRKGRGTATVLPGGTVEVAGTNGVSTANLFVGDNTTDTGIVSVGTFDMTGATLNATFDQVVLGRHNLGAGGGQGTLIIEAGLLTANSVLLADPDAGGSSSTDSATTGTLTINGGTVIINGTITDGDADGTGGGGSAIAAVNLNGGLLQFISASRSNGSTNFNINWAGGSIQNVASNNIAVPSVPIITSGAGTRTFIVDASQTGTVGSVISGPAGLFKTGGGLLLPTANNTYAGATVIDDGVLSISINANLGATPGSPTPEHLVIDGGILRTTATMTLSPNRGIAVGPAIGSGSGTIDVATGTLTYTGIIANQGTGVGGLTKIGTGTLPITTAHSYTGPTAIDDGLVLLNPGGTISGTSAISVGSGGNTATLTLANPIAYVLTPGGLSIGNGGTGVVQQNIAGSLSVGGVADTGISTLTLDVGTLTVASGFGVDTLRVGFRNTGGSSSANLAVNGGAVAIGSGVENLTIGSHTGPTNTTTVTGTVNLAGASSVDIDVANIIQGVITGTAGNVGSGNFAIGHLTLSAAGPNAIEADVYTISDSDFSGNADGAGSMLVFGAGDNELNADTIYFARRKGRATVTIGTGGTLDIAGRDGVSPANLFIGYNVAANTGLIANGHLNMTGGTLNATLGQVVLGAHGSAAGGGVGLITMPAGNVIANSLVLGLVDQLGASTNDANSSGTLQLNGGTFAVAGLITDGDADGTGSGGSSIATLNVAGGTLQFVTLSRSTVTNTFNVNVSAGAIQNVPGQNLAVTNVPLTLTGAGQRQVIIDAGQAGNVQSPINGPTTGLVKTGDGALALSGVNTYGGATSVNDGTLLVNGSTAVASSVAANAGGTLGGTGTINGPVQVNSGGIVNPGPLANVGTLTINNTITFNAGGIFAVDLNGSGAGQFDQLAVIGSGAVNIASGALITGTIDFIPNNTERLLVINKTSPGGVSGMFESLDAPPPPLVSPSTVIIGGKTFNTDYNSVTPPNNGFSLVLAAVAADYVWDGGSSVSNDWSDVINWVGDGGSPFAGDNIFFNDVGVGARPNPVNDDAPDTSFGTITLSNTTGDYHLTGNSVSLTGGIAASNGAGTTNHLDLVVGGVGGLTKTGDGALIVSQTQTYTGATAINGGTLLVDGSLAGTSSVVVGAGGTLAGTGAIASTIAINVAGVVAPGNPASAVGTLTTGSIDFAVGSSYSIQINGLGDADLLNVNGSVTLAGSLIIDLNYTPGDDDEFLIIQNDGVDPVDGQFAGLPAGTIVPGTPFKIFYNGGDGNDVVLKPAFVPVAYVNIAWDGLPFFALIPDANPETPAAEPAIFGYDAFADVTSAVASLTAGGIVYINQGDYSGDSAHLTGTQTISLLGTGPGPSAPSVILIGALSGSVDNTLILGIENTNAFSVGDASDTTFAGLVTGTGSFTKQGTGTLALTGIANDFTGAVTIDGGTLSASTLANSGSPSSIGIGSTITVNDGRLNYAGAASVGINRPITLGHANSTIGVQQSAATLTLNTGLVGAGGLGKNGDGTLSLPQVSAYAGNTTIAEGTLLVSSGNSIPNASNVSVGDTGVLLLAASETTSGLTLASGPASGAVVNLASHDLTLGGNVALVAIGDGAIGASITGVTGSSLQLGSVARIFTVANGNAAVDLLISTEVADGAFTKDSPGVLAFAGSQPNSYSGLTEILSGILSLAKSDNVLSILGPVNIAAGTLRIDADEQIADGIAIQLLGVNARLHSNTNTSETITAPNANFNGGEVLIGGELIIVGGQAVPYYATNANLNPTVTPAVYVQGGGGRSTLAGGTLRAGDSGGVSNTGGAANIQLLDGTLQGSGTIVANLLTNTGGNINPGNGNTTAGAITIYGNLILTSNSTVTLNVGATSDLIDVQINPNYPGPMAPNWLPTTGLVHFAGTLDSERVAGDPITVGDDFNVMNFEWRTLDNTAPQIRRLPSDFATKPLAADGNVRYDSRFVGTAGQLNAQSFKVSSLGVVVAPAFNLGQAKHLRIAAVPDAWASVQSGITFSQMSGNPANGHIYVTVTVTNTNAFAITGPIYLEVIPPGSADSTLNLSTKLFNKAGYVSPGNTSPSAYLNANRAYMLLKTTDFAAAGQPGSSQTIQIDLVSSSKIKPILALRVLAGGLP